MILLQPIPLYPVIFENVMSKQAWAPNLSYGMCCYGTTLFAQLSMLT